MGNSFSGAGAAGAIGDAGTARPQPPVPGEKPTGPAASRAPERQNG